MLTARKCLLSMLTAFGLLAASYVAPSMAADKESPKEVKPAVAKVDVNKATEEELTELPGIGDVTAKKIIANRPYKTAEDLTKAGLSEAKIAKIASMITLPHGTAHAEKKEDAKAPKEDAKAPKEMKVAKTEEKKDEKIDINHATAEELDDLPGVEPATAEKIIAGRPYKTIEDLVKAGVPEKTADKIASMITFGKEKAMAKDTKEEPKTTKTEKTEKMAKTDKTDKADKKDEGKDEVVAKVPPKKGMVWVNTETKIFHREGDRWYGKTKAGEFMTVDDAIKAGARAPKETMPKSEKEKASEK